MTTYGEQLAPGERRIGCYAASAVPSRGRVYPEARCPMRNEVQRDRDRILHSTAFRRLIYKTQMFVFHEGDHYRTRLTHSIEVAQIARAVARQLQLDEDLAEALALAHDLGHPPFGHAGERALNRIVRACGGFDHNVQSFRIVTALERKYPDFDGLNLCWETLEGLIKHNGPAPPPTSAAGKLMHRALRHFQSQMDLALGEHPSAEAQVAALADDIAWMTHDIDDGLRAGLISIEDMTDVTLTAQILANASPSTGGDTRITVRRERRTYEVVRQLITVLIADLVATSRANLQKLAPQTPADIRKAGYSVARFSPELWAQMQDLRKFLFARLYRHPWVVKVMTNAEAIVEDLVVHYCAHPETLPETWAEAARELNDLKQMRLVADFVAGMTDRYAIEDHRRLFDATPELL